MLSWVEAVELAKDKAWRAAFSQADERRRNPPALDEFVPQSGWSKAIMGTRVETSYAIVPVARFMELFQATAQELSALTIESFEDVDGTFFDGVVMKDQLSCKRLHVWVEHRAELVDHSLRVENHLRPGQGAEMQTALRASLIQARPKRGQGAEGRSQPPSLEEVRDMVQRGRAQLPATGRGAAAAADPGDESEEDSLNDRERVVEVSTVTPARAPAPGAGAAAAPGKRARAGGAWSTSKRPRAAAGPASVGSTSRGERRARVETIDGEAAEEGDVLSTETAKLDLGDLFMQKNPGAKSAIYNMAGASG